MQKPKYTAWVKSFARRYWYLLVLLIFISFGAVCIELITPLPLKFLADSVFGDYPPPHALQNASKSSLLIVAAIAYAVIYSLQTLYTAFQAYVTVKCKQHVDKISLKESYQAATTIPYGAENRPDTGTLLYQITNQSQQMSEYLFASCVSLVQSIVLFVGIIVILSYINLSLTLITLAIAPALAVCVIFFGNLLEKRANETEFAHAKVYGYVEESLAKLRTIQTFVLGKKRLGRLESLVMMRNKKAVDQLITNQLYDITMQVIMLAGIAVAILVGGNSVFAGLMTFGELLIFIAYTDDVYYQVSSMLQTIATMKFQAASLQQAYETIEEARRVHVESGDRTTPITGKIEYKNLTVSRSGKTVLDSVNLTIEPGSVVAFIGASGNGKTTLLNSLLRLITPDSGWVLVDGYDIKEYNLDYLRQQISLVEQEPDLFNDTIGENIAVSDQNRQFGLLDVSAAAHISNSTSFIEALPQKYDTLIDSEKLSGGQKQRLAVARAYYKKAPIVLLDEPTSALDKASARIFINNAIQYFKGRTMLIVTHDLSLLQHIPTIYVVENGQVRNISTYGGLEKYLQATGNGIPAQPAG